MTEFFWVSARDVLEVLLKFQSPDWSEFATSVATLALHFSEGVNPDKITEAKCPPDVAVPV